MLVIVILIFIVLPFLLICALLGAFDSKKQNHYHPDDDFLIEKDFYGRKDFDDDTNSPSGKNTYTSYADDIFNYTHGADPEDLREEDPDLYEDFSDF